MGAFLSYSIVSGLLLLAMYLAYRLFLARDNQHGFNRGVLMTIYVVSFASFPLMSRLTEIFQSSSPVLSMEGLEIVGTAAGAFAEPVWGTVLIWLYIAGMALVSIKTILTWARLIKVIRSGEKVKQDGYTLVLTDDERFAPFSWMRYVVVSRQDYEGGCPAITTHELKHVSSRHWLDLLIAQVVCIIDWFNPAAWLMRDELMLVHEYQADMAVIDKGHNPQEYQMLLIKKAVGARFPSLANSLNHSKLKKRITMMYKEKSGAGRKIKALALVPMLALALGVTGVPAVRAAMTTIGNSTVSISKGSEKLTQDKISVKTFKVTDIRSKGGETTVVIRGEGLGDNLTVSGGTFINKGKKYQATSLQCSMTDGTATITATFPFSGELKKTKMNLMVNGEEIPFNLEDVKAIEMKANAAVSASNATTIIVDGKQSELSDMDIYVNDVKIDASGLNDIDPGKITSITVNRQNNKLSITSK